MPLLPRYTHQTPIDHDPFTELIAQREAADQRARAAVAAGRNINPNPQDLRGIPCIARGVGGTSPGTNPWTAIDRLDAQPTR